ncbi:MAG TPA: metallopeptidase family protein [Candidatus Saccharimonadales bacterium]|nr:metallopeptidase family protein [Candidatus Saccharimonadales bacterium]
MTNVILIVMQISDEKFQDLIAEAAEAIAPKYKARMGNVAILYEDEPTSEQREKLALRNDQTLLGLYEGVPLPARGGATKILPDKITLFKKPLLNESANLSELNENIRHTLWHEVAHYFGLNHERIHELEK